MRWTRCRAPGRKTLRLRTSGAALEAPGREQSNPKPFTAARDGFSRNAAVACKSGERRKLRRLCRNVARPAIALERLSRDGDGLVVYELEHAFRDGTTHVLFEPLDFSRSRHLTAMDGGQMPEATSPNRG